MTDQLPALVDRQGQPIVSKKRIRPALATAIRLIVTEGYTIKDAAKAVGYVPHAVTQALRKPHVRAFRADVKRAWMESQTEKAWRNVADLAQGAQSEDVRLKASRTILEAAGELTPGAEKGDGPRNLINIGRQEIHHHHPPTERMPGVVEIVSNQLLDEER